MTRLEGTVEKGWGKEDIWVTNDKYCSKFLVFKKDKSFSMHFHVNKLESWYVVSGSFKLETIDLADASREIFILQKGDVYTINPLSPHRLTALEEESTILEVSTPDSVEDNYRVLPGDSQKRDKNVE